jgi:hypothetical protein
MVSPAEEAGRQKHSGSARDFSLWREGVEEGLGRPQVLEISEACKPRASYTQMRSA